MLSLIALGRIYYRGERLDFKVERTARNAFTAAQESVSVDTNDATEFMRLKILWPTDCGPKAIRLGRATPSWEWKSTDVTADLKNEGGRPMYQADIHAPEKGSCTTIEWDWEPMPKETLADAEASDSN